MSESSGQPWKSLGARHGCVQINEKQLLVFGGDIGEHQVDDCWVLTMGVDGLGTGECSVARWCSLPVCGDVWSPVVVHQGRVYCIVKSEREHKQVVYTVECDGEAWKTVL